MESNAAEFNRATAACRGQCARDRGARDRGARVEDLVQSAHRRGAALEKINDPAEGDERPREVAHVEPERDELTDRDDTAKHQRSTEAEHHDGREAGEKTEGRACRAVEPHETHVLREVRIVQRSETRDLGGLLAVCADNPRTGEVLLGVGRDGAEVILHGLEAIVDHASDADHDEWDEHHRQHGEPGELGTHAQHEHEREDAAGDRVHEVHDGGAGGHADGAQVVRQARHGVTRARAGEVGGVERFEVGEERVAQIVFHVAAQSIQALAHAIAERAAQDSDDDHGRGDVPYADERGVMDDAVDPLTEEPKDDDTQGRCADHQEQT